MNTPFQRGDTVTVLHSAQYQGRVGTVAHIVEWSDPETHATWGTPCWEVFVTFDDPRLWVIFGEEQLARTEQPPEKEQAA